MRKHTDTHDEGMALLLATLFISVALIITSALALRMFNEKVQVDAYVVHEDCMYGIETAFAQSRAALEAREDANIGVSETISEEFDGEMPGFDEDGVDPLDVPGMPDLEYFAIHEDWENDGQDNNGDGSVDGLDEKWFHAIYVAAREKGIVRSAEVIISGEDVNVWRNAIFAGAGQAGGLINGNVSIHGSVHLLGDQVLPGAEAITALDMSGTSLIHNNYEGIPAELEQRVPPLPTTNFGGENGVDTLSAKLRVRHGLVGLSGNSEIGEPDVFGNGYKETMDGAYVSDGWTGNAVTDDGDRGDPQSVHSDNGWDELYDLGDRVPMPMLTDDWLDPEDGHREWDGSRLENYTHEHFFDEVLVGDPVDPTDGIYHGNITIRCNQDFYYNASRPGDPDPANRQPDDDYMLFDESTDVLEINGHITIDGDLTITRGGGNDKTINYTGRAALLVHGDVTLDTDLYTVNADGTTADSFPVNNILGIMAEDDMVVGSLSQLRLMGAFYAQGRIICSKQTIVMGTFVSNYFDMGSQVPDIYQVPTLADNLPHGMIGAYPILFLSQVSWRELLT